MIDTICDISKCTGCSACKNICPTGAIDMEEGLIGHIFPSISEKCIECKKCVHTCPVNKEAPLLTPQKVYAAWVNDDNEHHTSTSGGAAACFTNTCLEHNGVVYGAASLPRGVIRHIRIDNKDDAWKLKGSKYVHSHINDKFKDVKKDLDDRKDVLFIGLPCQVAGLKNYIGCKDERLICVDLICHGVPSQRVLFDYLKAKGHDRQNIQRVGFREEKGFYLTVSENGKIVYREPEYNDYYYMAFNDNLCFRNSCYACRYATEKRCGDITIGDFWGLGKREPFNYDTHGNVSVIMINNNKGAEFLNQCSSKLTLIERSLGEAVAGNHNLSRPSFSASSAKFKDLYEKTDIVTALGRCIWKRRLKAPFYPALMWFLGKIR